MTMLLTAIFRLVTFTLVGALVFIIREVWIQIWNILQLSFRLRPLTKSVMY